MSAQAPSTTSSPLTTTHTTPDLAPAGTATATVSPLLAADARASPPPTGTMPAASASQAAVNPRAAATQSLSAHKVECWGHRGASAHLPENTLASYRAAIKEGAEGIESDVHLTKDGYILMFHDPTLDRTTDGTGAIKEQNWVGGIEHVRTTKQPVQPIPRFEELIELLMEPENRHVVLNIDCKIQNDPEAMFPIMADVVAAFPDYETVLAPRLILGLWHPLFLSPARRLLPAWTRYHIGLSPAFARRYFWDVCAGFSMAFPVLVGSEGQAFLRECKAAGKAVTVWTVNEREEMVVAAGWGVRAVLTDKVQFFVDVRREFEEDPRKLQLPLNRRLLFPWSNWKYYSLAHASAYKVVHTRLTTQAYIPGPYEEVLKRQAEEHPEGEVRAAGQPAVVGV